MIRNGGCTSAGWRSADGSRTGNSDMFSDAALVADGTLIDKPLCPPGTDTEPQIFVAPSIFSANEKSPPLAAMQAWATSESDTQWRVHLRVLKGDGKGLDIS